MNKLTVTHKQTTESLVTFDLNNLPIYRKAVYDSWISYFKIADYNPTAITNTVKEIRVSGSEVELRTAILEFAFGVNSIEIDEAEWNNAVKLLKNYAKAL